MVNLWYNLGKCKGERIANLFSIFGRQLIHDKKVTFLNQTPVNPFRMLDFPNLRMLCGWRKE